MILFIFEGKNDEPKLYKTLSKLFSFELKEEDVAYYFCNNIFSLYNEIKSYSIKENDGDLSSVLGDIDIINILKEEGKNNKKNINVLEKIKHSYEVSEIFLFFDFDIHKIDYKNIESYEEQVSKVVELMNFFNNPNDEKYGIKLYINYPMIESYKYFRTPLPDENYKDYTVKLYEINNFKKFVSNFCNLKNTKYLCYDLNKNDELKQSNDKEREEKIKQNWLHIKEMNIKKANYITTDNYLVPENKLDISQEKILDNQIRKYISPKNEVAVLNAFPLFWFEYIDEQKVKLGEIRGN